VALRRELKQVVLEIADTGIGISADYADHLFERFFRARPTRRT
jgi:signal transduction histidine kinase